MNLYGRVTDVPGIRVGQVSRSGGGWLTGVSVVVPPPGTTAAVDVRGGGPGTHETDALAPGTLVEHVDAVVLTGGSAYGLAAAHGVQAWCEQAGRGFGVGGGTVVPVVPAAALFDLGRGGDRTLRPDASMGWQAAAGAGTAVDTGSVGAGTGAVLAGATLKGGTGTASVRLPGGVVVGALVVTNAAGSPHAADGSLYAAAFVDDPALRPRSPREQGARDQGAPQQETPGRPPTPPPASTTLAVVATNARVDVAAARRLAGAGHDGLARALRPVHTLFDGDTVFALSTGELDPQQAAAAVPGWPGAAEVAGMAAVQSAAADAVLLATLDAVLSATAVHTSALDVAAYLDRWPSARPPALRARTW